MADDARDRATAARHRSGRDTSRGPGAASPTSTGGASHEELLAAFPDVADPAATESWLTSWLNDGDRVAPSSPVTAAGPSAPPSPGAPASAEVGNRSEPATPTIVRSPVLAAPPSSVSPVVVPSPPERTRRPSRWDRPKPPRDWRWAVGGIGRALIAIGLLMFAFVAYQLWGTGIQTAQSQRELESEFDRLLASVTTLPVPTTTESAPSTVPPTAAPTTGPTPTMAPATVAPTVASTAPPTTALPPVIERPEIGGLVGKIEIPSIGLGETYVVEGTARGELQRGPGHFPGSPLPGQLGNAAIAGHRTTFGAPFGDLHQLDPGEQVIVTTPAGRYVYVVVGGEVVSPTRVDVVATKDWDVAMLTLVTCDPPRTATKRLIVYAVLDPTLSSITTQPSPPAETDGDDDVVALPGEVDPSATESTDGVPVGTDAPTDSADPPATETTAVATGPTTVPTEPAPPTSVGDPASPVEPIGGSEDAFGGGWFDDSGAWSHVVLWGLALAAVWIGIYALSRAVRRYWVGVLVGFVPFVVVLYFWFENVNRLLPPGM